MRNFLFSYRDETPLEIEAIDEKDALFQWCSITGHDQYTVDLNEVKFVEIKKPIQPAFVRVHLGFITVNLIPDLAKQLGYKEGDRFPDEPSMFAAIGTQNIFIIEDFYKQRNIPMPTDLVEAANFMVESIQNQN